MNDDPFKWLRLKNIDRDEGEVKNANPETWFHRWLRIELMVIAIGMWLLVIAALIA